MIIQRGKRHLFALETELEFVVVRTFGAVVFVVFVFIYSNAMGQFAEQKPEARDRTTARKLSIKHRNTRKHTTKSN